MKGNYCQPKGLPASQQIYLLLAITTQYCSGHMLAAASSLGYFIYLSPPAAPGAAAPTQHHPLLLLCWLPGSSVAVPRDHVSLQLLRAKSCLQRELGSLSIRLSGSWPWPDPPRQHQGHFPIANPLRANAKFPRKHRSSLYSQPPSREGGPGQGDAAGMGTGPAGLHPGTPAPLSRHGVGHHSSGCLLGASEGGSKAPFVLFHERRAEPAAASLPRELPGSPSGSEPFPVLPDGPDSSRPDLEPRRINSPRGLPEPQLL